MPEPKKLVFENLAHQGFVSLREIAINKMLKGVTTYDEVISMTG